MHFSSILILIGVRKWLRVNLTLFLLWEKICAFTWNSSSISHRFWTWTCHFIDNNKKKNGHKKFSLFFLTNVCVIFTRNSELEKYVTRKLILIYCFQDWFEKKRVTYHLLYLFSTLWTFISSFLHYLPEIFYSIPSR